MGNRIHVCMQAQGATARKYSVRENGVLAHGARKNQSSCVETAFPRTGSHGDWVKAVPIAAKRYFLSLRTELEFRRGRASWRHQIRVLFRELPVWHQPW